MTELPEDIEIAIDMITAPETRAYTVGAVRGEDHKAAFSMQFQERSYEASVKLAAIVLQEQAGRTETDAETFLKDVVNKFNELDSVERSWEADTR